jgi:hypothetical protein
VHVFLIFGANRGASDGIGERNRFVAIRELEHGLLHDKQSYRKRSAVFAVSQGENEI